MKRFNKTTADQIVINVINEHINQYGNILYQPTGCLPYVNGDKVLGNKNYRTFIDKVYTQLRNEFGYSKSLNKYTNVYIGSVIRSSSLSIGTCNFDINDIPTYTEPKDIKPITIEYVNI
jgi:hypothetical protein